MSMLQQIAAFLDQPYMKELVRLALTLLGLFAAFRIVSALTRRLPRGKLSARMDPGALSFLSSFLNIGLKLVLVVLAAGVVGVPTSSLVAILGSAGVAVGLAMQGSLSNLAGGLMILFFRPFKLGDYIEEAGGKAGYVADISIFYTTLRGRDNSHIVLPNGSLSNGRVVNYSSLSEIRVTLPYSVAYGADANAVIELLRRCALDSPCFLTTRMPAVQLTSMADSALIFTVFGWCGTVEDYFSAPGDMNMRVRAAFDKAGIEIPFPQMDVHMKA